MAYSESKVLSKVKLDKDLTKKITQNTMSGRIFVEFSAPNAKLFLQKSFQDTYLGRKEVEEFANSINNLSELKFYFEKRK